MKNSKTNITLLILCIASSLVPFMSSAINLALPDIIQDLALNSRIAGWIPTSYMLATAICQIPCAKLADMFGRKRIFVLGISIFAIFTLVCAFVSSGESLITARVLSGLGSAMMFGTSTAILTSSVPSEKRGWALGITTSVTYISLAAGPFLGGILTTHFGWKSIFYVAAFLAIIPALGAHVYIKGEWKEENKSRFDYVGTILYSTGLFALIYGFTILPSTFGVVLLISGILITLMFIKHQQKAKNPVFNINLFLKNRVFRLSSFSALINYAATFAIAFMLSMYLQYVKGLNPQEAGLVLITQAVIQSGTSLFSGRLSDRIPPAILATIGMALTVVGLILLSFISADTSYVYIILVQIILGLGFGIFSSPNVNTIMSSVDKKDYSMASASIGTMRLTGQSLSMAIAMMSISYTVGNVQLSSQYAPEIVMSSKITFISCAILCLIGVYTSSARLKKNGKG